MARPLRIDVAGGWYHITARGRNRERIHDDARDCADFLARFDEMGQRYFLWIAHRCGCLPLRERGAEAGGMDYAAVSEAIRSCERRDAIRPDVQRALRKASEYLKLET